MFVVKSNKLWSVLSIIVLTLQVLAEAAATFVLLKLDMLPGKYVLVLVALMLVLLIPTVLLLFLKRKGGISTLRRIIAFILALLTVCFCGFVTQYAATAYNTMQAVSNDPVETAVGNMYVLVRADDPAQTLADAVQYKYAVLQDYDTEYVTLMCELITEETGVTPQVTGLLQSGDMATALLDKNMDALIMSGATIALLIEEEAFANFLTQVKILYSASDAALEQRKPTETEATTEPTEPEPNVSNTPFVIYISGSDSKSNVLNVSRSDVNILMVVNPLTKQILLINTPRDYYVANPRYGGKKDKLTHCGLHGVSNSMEALGILYDVDVQHYGRINFRGFEKLIDAIGGITVYSDQSFVTWRGTKVVKGENYMNGYQALGFARERYRVSGGDYGRGNNQMKVIKAVVDKMTSSKTLITHYSSIMTSMEGMFATSLESSDISALVKMQVSDMATWEVFSYSVTGKGGSAKTASAPNFEAYVMYPVKSSVAHATNLIDRLMAGEILTQEDMTVPK